MSTPFWKETDVHLMTGEEVLHRGEPDRDKLRKLNLCNWFAASVCFFPLLFLLPIYLWSTRRSADRHQFYVTNFRVIVTDGLIGYTTRSVPFERISDVGVWWSML